MRVISPVRSALLRGTAAVIAASLYAHAGAQTARPAPEAPPTAAEQIAALIKARKPQEALARADDVLAKQPRNVQVRFLRAVLLGDLGRSAEAAAALESMTQDFPELPEPHNNLGVMLAGQGRYEQARAALQRAVAAAPDYVTAHENLGDLYLAMAADAYRQAAELDPKSGAIQNKLKLARELVARVPTIK